MADVRESFPVLEDSATQVGQPLHKVLEGDTPASKNALIGFSFKDSSGNVVLPQLTSEGKIAVDTEAAGGVCKYARGTASGSATNVNVASLTLTASKIYRDISWVVSCFRDAIFEIVWIDDEGDTPVETILGDVIVGPGDFTDSGRLHCVNFTAGGTGIQKLYIRAKNLNALSDFRATVSVSEGL